MKRLQVVVWLSLCAPVWAQVYRCPETYPADTEGHRLANADMRIGERHRQTPLHGDIADVKDGSDIHYNFPDETPRWLVCQYGGKRIGATAISPAQVVNGREWSIQLSPLADMCDLNIREHKGRGGQSSTWTAVATCTGKPLPPPVMLE
jgi:hypothetical protein